jgi:DNA polymerase
MTAAEKTGIARFLDLAGAKLSGGYLSAQPEYNFEDDVTVGEVGLATSQDSLSLIAEQTRSCTACKLCHGRKNVVPGEGVPHPLVLVIGEGPGADEDASGRPCVGAAGQLLDRMLASIKLSREKNCFIANIVKCRPPGNRDPENEEAASCMKFLERQITLLSPLLILSAGRTSAKNLLNTVEGITRLRGKWKALRGIPLLPTFHPSYLLRDESQKAFAWEDMKSLSRRLAELDASYAAETEELRGKWG